ncbi:GntR family transcriptional regulator [Ochrobactrum sp. BTU1]|uniref:GntR family transcriptional regulator n=1 Tax=Ochrobactrum sp. BTU1 TaxID=2840456 RepID=UPI001C04110A|nr:GntR family transcriptional regulator [Ochrobactrum sp. BTU1]
MNKLKQESGAPIGPKPLYAQVRDQLVRRLVTGEWTPGMILPSEQEIARSLSVSQGTVRKALDAMTADNLLVRRQGRGTFVAQPEDSRIMFQFFRLVLDGGETDFPQSLTLATRAVQAPANVSQSLELPPGTMMLRVERVRTLAGNPVINEVIWLPKDRFPGFDALDAIPNNIYQLISARWGITIARADEQLRATVADEIDAQRLACPLGHPLLAIQRVAVDLEDKPVELRQSRCLTTTTHYAVSLR